ncbi:unnamed protein product [Trichogramma brassicae]|uniref:CASAMP N-terminal domain-containing protein n=1 Tax=Trichogramma brassicae TaxID=86971 RepID=A0A6H5I858_9HYME|nr:unnamed protein product [Trichogramma brassicae]
MYYTLSSSHSKNRFTNSVKHHLVFADDRDRRNIYNCSSEYWKIPQSVSEACLAHGTISAQQRPITCFQFLTEFDYLSFMVPKQRASVKWLLSKAYNNRVPEKLREPYYRDHEVDEAKPGRVFGRDVQRFRNTSCQMCKISWRRSSSFISRRPCSKLQKLTLTRGMLELISNNAKTTSEEAFVAHRNKGVPTISTAYDDKTPVRAEAAGRPSNWDENRRSTYAGRRSRRNSISAEDSQLTIENFGGSQEISEDVRDVEHKWLDQDATPYVETRRTPDIENMDYDQYHQSITQMNSSLTEIQQDIQRLASQQNQIQQQHLLAQQHQQMQQQLQQLQSLSQQQQHLHCINKIQECIRILVRGEYQYRNQKGFVLHDSTQDQRYLNGGEHSLSNNQHHVSSYSTAQNLFNQTPTGSASPQHRNAVHRISQLMNDSVEVKRQSVHHISMQCENNSEKRLNSMHQQEVEPSNVSYLVNEEDFNQGMRNLNITSGSRTYRIPSPTRPSISRNSFQPHSSLREKTPSPSGNASEVVPLESSDASGKGFYISFDDVPKKPKPSLRTKKLSPKKERSVSSYIDENDFIARYDPPPASTAIDRQRQQIAAQKEIEKEKRRQAAEEREQQFQKQKELKDREAAKEQQKERQRNVASEKGANSVGLLIGNQLAHPDPNSIDEMERKKEKIMLMSLQRRQQQEELKARKEAEAQRRRDEEKLKEEERARKKEEEKARRASILEQYKLKKAIEEAEREIRQMTDGVHRLHEAIYWVDEVLTRHHERADILVDSCYSLFYQLSRERLRAAKFICKTTFIDTDSGLGRATPPRRAASPGMGSMRHLPSPSGPGSLPPGLMTKRRVFDDGSSDISSTASSMMDYNGRTKSKLTAYFTGFWEVFDQTND